MAQGEIVAVDVYHTTKKVNFLVRVGSYKIKYANVGTQQQQGN